VRVKRFVKKAVKAVLPYGILVLYRYLKRKNNIYTQLEDKSTGNLPVVSDYQNTSVNNHIPPPPSPYQNILDGINSLSDSTTSNEKTYERLRLIVDFFPHCEHYLSKICDPKDKSILVIGCGWGTEMLWSILNGAERVVGIDVAEKNDEALKIALKLARVSNICDYEIHQMHVEDIAKINQKFDLVLSNNVFEHLPDISKAMNACKKMLKDNGKIAIFADPLFYSSCGSHLEHGVFTKGSQCIAEPWEHLWNEMGLRNKVGEYKWNSNFATMNNATLIDFINAISENNLVILQFGVIPDRNLANYSYLEKALICGKTITDLSTEGVFMELALYKNINDSTGGL